MKKLLIVLLFIVRQALCQELHFKNIAGVPDASFRGLSVVDDSVAWVSGSKGYVGRSMDGGNGWAFKKVKGFEGCDFRSLYAFNTQTAIIANAGVPAVILRTSDGGITWGIVYKNDDTAAFFDGVDFWNDKEGIIYGDPLNGHMMILLTHDGGRSWQELPEPNRPALAIGEASFAASGTCIRCLKNGKVMIATGGMASRLLVSNDKGVDWRATETAIIQGSATTGIFSMAFLNEKTGIIVGGDYKRDTLKTNHIFYTNNGGNSWAVPQTPTRGYRECVAYISPKTVIATGPGGTDVSDDGGINWMPFSDEKGLHVIRKSRKGSLIVMAGSGKMLIGRL